MTGRHVQKEMSTADSQRMLGQYKFFVQGAPAIRKGTYRLTRVAMERRFGIGRSHGEFRVRMY